MLKVASLFTGAGGFDAALERCGMKVIWQAEIDRQCRSVTARHWPDVVMYDDVRRVRAYLEPKNERRTSIRPERPDLLCGGFPCQDISVAGRRAGLAGSRSGLWFTFRRIAALVRPRWLLIENVDGLRSSNKGRDLGAILKALGDMGYGWAYRVFDSQWFGLAQRRERVFIVGCLGNWRRATEVLFERDCLPWNPAPSRETGARVAASLTRGTSSGRGVSEPGRRREDDVNLVASCQTAGEGKLQDGESVNMVVTHTLRAEGFDASEDGTGRGVPLIAATLRTPSKGATYKSDGQDCLIPIDMRQASRGGTFTNNRPGGSTGGAPGTGIGEPGDPAFTVCDSHPPAVAFYCNENHSSGNNDNISPTLKCGTALDIPTSPAIAYAIQERAGAVSDSAGPGGKGWQEDIGYTLESRHTAQAIAFDERNITSKHNRSRAENGLPCHTLHSDAPRLATGYGVRRLTPRECERLQGFPDDWTRWDADGNELTDSPRYRMMGNAVSLPPVEWIGRRIVEAAA